MAQLITITNPLTGQPQQMWQSDFTAQQIDNAVAGDSGTVSGGIEMLDSLTTPGVYTWIDSAGILGVIGSLYDVVVVGPKYGSNTSVSQIFLRTFPGVAIFCRSFYFANNPQWTKFYSVSLSQLN